MPTPQHCPSPRELADLELLSVGALAPLTAFNEPGSRVTLTLQELNAYVVGEVAEFSAQGVRNPRLELGNGSASGKWPSLRRSSTYAVT